MESIPAPLDEDSESVAWALTTARALWNRQEREDALVWLRRAVDAARAQASPWRAEELGRAAERVDPRLRKSQRIVAVLAALEAADGTPVDPWSSAETPSGTVPRSRATVEQRLTEPLQAGAHSAVLTSAPRGRFEPPGAAFEEEEGVPISIVEASQAEVGPRLQPADLAALSALSDFPEDTLGQLAERARVVRLADGVRLRCDALACVLSGNASVWSVSNDADGAKPSNASAPLADVGGAEAVLAGAFCGLAAASSVAMELRGEPDAVVAVWNHDELAAPLRECPWVSEDWRERAVSLVARRALAIGVAAMRLDGPSRARVLHCAEARALEPEALLCDPGDAPPGLVFVAAGSVFAHRRADSADARVELGPGEPLFVLESLEERSVTATVQAGAEGAILLIVPLSKTRELFGAQPVLLDLVAVA